MRHEDDAPIKALDAIRERCHGLKVKVVRRLVEHEDVRLDVPDEGRTQTHSDAISQGAEYLMKEAIRRTQMQSPKGRRTAVQG